MCAAGRDAPLCRCGERSLTDLRTAELRRRWSDAEGVKWSWVSSGRALWYLCEPCHHQAWPEDGRCNNRHSRPVAQRRDLGYATRLMAGNLSLGLSVLPSVRRSVLCGLVWSLSVSVRLFCVVSSGGSDLVLSGLFCSRLVRSGGLVWSLSVAVCLIGVVSSGGSGLVLSCRCCSVLVWPGLV